MSKERKNVIKDFLDRSSIATTIVVFAAIFGFLIASANGIYTLSKAYFSSKKSIRVFIQSMPFHPTTFQCPVSRLFPIDPNWPIQTKDPRYISKIEYEGRIFYLDDDIDVPCFKLTLKIRNEKNENSSLSDFTLYIKYRTEQKYLHSFKYVMDGHLDEFDMPLYLKPNEVRKVEIGFLFWLSQPYLDTLKNKKLVNYYLTTMDQNQNFIKVDGFSKDLRYLGD